MKTSHTVNAKPSEELTKGPWQVTTKHDGLITIRQVTDMLEALETALEALEAALAALEASLEADDPQASAQMEWEQEPLPTIRAAIAQAKRSLATCQ